MADAGEKDSRKVAPMTEAIHPLDEYINYLKRIIKLIRQNGAQIIFATTTPIYESGSSKDNTGTEASINYSNDWVVTYNAAAIELMKRENILVNDLYSLCLKGPKYYKCEDMLHLTEEGYMEIAKQTAMYIRQLI